MISGVEAWRAVSSRVRAVVAVGLVLFVAVAAVQVHDRRWGTEATGHLLAVADARADVQTAVLHHALALHELADPGGTTHVTAPLARLAEALEAATGAPLAEEIRTDIDVITGLAAPRGASGVDRGALERQLVHSLEHLGDRVDAEVDRLESEYHQRRLFLDRLGTLGLLVSVGTTALVIVALVGSDLRSSRADRAREEGEGRFQTLIDHAMFGVALVRDGRVLHLNPSGARILGVDRHPVEELDLGPLLGAATVAPDGRPSLLGDVRVHTRPDRVAVELIVDVSTVPMDGATVSLVLFQDVTARRRAERERAEALHLLQAIADHSPDSIFAKDRKGRYLLFNREASRVTGVPPERALGHDDRVAFEQADAAMVIANDAGVMATGQIRVYEESLHTPHGVRIFQATKGPITDGEGKVVGMFGISRDITERLQVETALRASESRYRRMVESLGEGVVVFDAAGSVEACNPAAERILGMDLARLRVARPSLRDWRSIRTDGTPFPATELPVLRSLATGVRCRGVVLGDLAEDGRTTWLEVSSEPTREPGSNLVTGAVVLFTDVTARVLAEQELARHQHQLEELVAMRTAALAESERRLQAVNADLASARDRAEEASRAKSSFLANVSHEIRTPISGIIGLIHLLEAEPLPDTVRSRLARITAAARHLLAVINDLLDLSKVDAGALALENVPFEIPEVVDRVVETMREEADAKGLALEWRLAEGPSRVRGDPTRVVQALLNLVGNAVKFTEAGRVNVEVARVEPDLVRFSVTDTGVGVAPEVIGSLFQPFVQGDSSTSRRYGGTGLGLAITRRLARRMGGDAGCSSVVGLGSTFWFTARLPPAEADVASGAAEPGGHAPGAEPDAVILRRHHAGARILVVEDNPVNQEVAAELLARVGMEARVVGTGEEALVVAEEVPFDLVLLDLRLPGLDGVGVARRLRGVPSAVRVPIVALTASAHVEDRAACFGAGVDDFLTKPVDVPGLYKVLRRWLPVTRAEAPPAPATADVPLPTIPGLATARAAATFGGRRAVYLSLLRTFVRTYQDAPPPARTPEALGRFAHELRGAAGMIGADGVVGAAAAVESAVAGQEPEAVEAAADALDEALAGLVAALRAQLPDEPPADVAR